jgi:hypothetical protein
MDFDDDLNPEEVEFPHSELPKPILFELSQFIAAAVKRDMKTAKLVNHVLDQLYDAIGEDYAPTAIMGYVARRHRWDIDIIAEGAEVENILLRDHSIFDDDMWAKVLNTDAISDLHHEVYKLGVQYMDRAINEVLLSENKEEQI